MRFSDLQEMCGSLGIPLSIESGTYPMVARSELVTHEVVDWCFKKKARLTASLLKNWKSQEEGNPQSYTPRLRPRK